MFLYLTKETHREYTENYINGLTTVQQETNQEKGQKLKQTHFTKEDT